MTPSDPPKAGQWHKIFDYMLGYEAAWVLDIGLRSGLLRIIADKGPLTDLELQAETGFDSRYLRVWCRAAYAFEVVDWQADSGYRLAPHMRDILLTPDDPQFLGGRLQFYVALWEDFRAFPKYLRDGGSWARSEHDPELLHSLESMTKPDAAMIVRSVLPQLEDVTNRLAAGGTVLDIGSGAGFLAIQLADRFPTATIVGLESDATQAELARAAVSNAGQAGGVTITVADANELQDANMYDLITLNVALHETGGPTEWANVLRRVHQALKPGGAVIVSELPYPDEVTAYRQQPIYKALAGVLFHETLVGCGAITQNTLHDLLASAGFAAVRVAEQPVATRFVMVAERSGS